MASETEPAKTLLPYLQRADELQKHEPLVAYYCRLYAMEKGLKIPVKERTKTTNSILVSLMSQLEKDKKSLKLGPEDNLYVEGFASNVFAKADKQDRAGRADLNTAKTFYAAAIFFEILYQFGELQPDIEQKQKYASWKAADIRKALKEGRKPEPGPPGGDKDLSLLSTALPNTYDTGHTESSPGQQPAVDFSHHTDKSDFQRHPDNLPSTPSSYPGPGFLPSALHQPPVAHSAESSTYPQQLQDQSYSEQQPTHLHYPSEGHPAATHKQYPSDGHPAAIHKQYPSEGHQAPSPSFPSEGHTAPSYPSQDKPVHSYSPGGVPTNYPSYDTGAPHSYPGHDNSLENYPSTHENAPQHYPSHEASGGGYTYSNFQTYPSFSDSTLPAAPTHHSPYYGSDANQPSRTAHASAYPSAAGPYDSTRQNGSHNAAPSPPPPAASYAYDSSYQPPVEKIAEAHKAARFAVGALAFDDVTIAVDFLRRSLELLTNPSAETHH